MVKNKLISQNPPESEVIANPKTETASQSVVKLDDFVTQKENAKSPIQALIRHISREVNRQKLSYDQLKYVFRSVRASCGVEAPARGRKLYELPSCEEMRRFYSEIENPIHRLIFETLEGTGLRIAELCSLQMNRIDFKNNTGFISEGKGKKDRIIIIGDRLLEKLCIYLQDRKNKYLFESNRHTKFTPRRIEQLCKLYKMKSKILKNLTPHTFRHIFITKLAELGITAERRAIIAGHSDLKTQQLYNHLSAGGFRDEIIKALDTIHTKRDRPQS